MDSLPFFDLMMNAGLVVKGVLLLLAAASVASWAIAFEKLFRILAFSRHVSELTAGRHGARPELACATLPGGGGCGARASGRGPFGIQCAP